MSKNFRKRAFRAYQKVKTLKPARSLFDLSHDVLATMDMGKLYPGCIMEMSPGDTFHIWMESVTRMQPLNAPILHDLKFQSHWFFVPYRILWSEWVDFITGGEEGEYGGNTRGEDSPSDVTPSLPRWNPSNTLEGSLWDYCGFPVGVTPTGALPLDFVRRCYNRVWNEYYRDENLQEEVSEDNEDILYRNWKKDYFTSALLSQQRGIAPSLPLTGSGVVVSRSFPMTMIRDNGVTGSQGSTSCSITFHSDLALPDEASFYPKVPLALSVAKVGDVTQYSVSFTSVVSKTIVDSHTVTVTYLNSSGETYFIGEGRIMDESVSTTFSTQVADLDNVASSDIKDLRVAFQIQRWLELANRGGVRYTEFLRSFFGVSPRDDRLQRPEYVGGTSSPIVISEVLQTSSTDSEPTPQGNMAGHGIGADRTFVGSYTAVEYGILMSFCSIMPSAKYQQGINRQWLRRTKFDFLFPQFTGLSEQAIEEAEIYATDSEDTNRKVFGFNEIYDELRSMPSRIVGKMRSTFDYWHLGRKFDSAPALNSDFITCNPSKRIFAVPSEDGFIVNLANIIRAVRPIPKYGTPRGV